MKPSRFKERLKKLFSWLSLLAGIVAFSWMMALGMEQQQKDLSKWAKGVDYRHCWGKFDTPECHERKAKENAAAYREYSRN